MDLSVNNLGITRKNFKTHFFRLLAFQKKIRDVTGTIMNLTKTFIRNLPKNPDLHYTVAAAIVWGCRTNLPRRTVTGLHPCTLLTISPAYQLVRAKSK